MKCIEVVRQTKTNIDNVWESAINDICRMSVFVKNEQEQLESRSFVQDFLEGANGLKGRPRFRSLSDQTVFGQKLVQNYPRNEKRKLQNGLKSMPNCKQHTATGEGFDR